MDYTCRTKTLQALSKAIEKENILLSHKLQRPEGQWNRTQKTDLIDSLLRKYPINPTYGIKEEGVISIIDGVQRLSCVRDFLADKFALSKNMEPVIVNGNEKTLAGLKFSKLDEDTKDAILNSELQLYELIDCSEKDVREMFRRQNAGKPLSNGQLRIVKETDELSNIIYSLTQHPFFSKTITKAQLKKNLDKDIVREIIMLTEMSDTYDFGSFRSKDIDAFIEYYNNHINTDKIELLKKALDELDKAFEENIKIKQTSLPMICFGMYKVISEDKSASKYINWIKTFLSNYDTNTEYIKYCGTGTANAENVKGRLNYFETAIKSM